MSDSQSPTLASSMGLYNRRSSPTPAMHEQPVIFQPFLQQRSNLERAGSGLCRRWKICASVLVVVGVAFCVASVTLAIARNLWFTDGCRGDDADPMVAFPGFTGDARADAVALALAMTGLEKCSLLRGIGYAPMSYSQSEGYYVGNTPAIERLGVPALKIMDAAQGFRTIDKRIVGQVTSWPCMLAAAATWDEDLLERWGRALGAEFRAKGANVLLGPSVNIHRVARGGRNAEYLSGEEPYLGQRLAPPYIRGVQSQRVMAVVKHFALNNQETRRTASSSVADARTMWEVYYVPFRAAVSAGVASVMCGYNLVNGVHACGNEGILTRDLKMSMGFTGWVMSDWWAATSFGAPAGLDQEMPGNGCTSWSPWISCYFNNANLRTLSDAKVNDMVSRILTPAIQFGVLSHSAAEEEPSSCAPPACDELLYGAEAKVANHTTLALELATAGIVLLKNEGGVLPIRGHIKKLAVLGSACDAKNDVDQLMSKWNRGNAYVVGGSGRVIPSTVASIRAGLAARAGVGLELLVDISDNVASAVSLAWAADLAIICGSASTGEEEDRASLSVDQEAFIRQVVAEGPPKRVVVVTMTPGVILMPWVDRTAAAVTTFLAGEQVGHAVAAVLFGDANPSGKSPVTFPVRQEDTVPPCANVICNYTEGLHVGWRALEGKPVHFPFGHGLSYTAFEYDLVGLHTAGANCNGAVCAAVELRNAGSMRGAEVAQLYLGFPESAGEPPKVLRGFHKVVLQPEQIASVTFTLSPGDLQIYDSAAEAWHTPDGQYQIFVGSSSRDVRIVASFEIKAGHVHLR